MKTSKTSNSQQKTIGKLRRRSSAPVAVYLPRAQKRRLEKLALEQGRSVSNLMAFFIAKGVSNLAGKESQ